MNDNISRFLESEAFGVVGASTDRNKYGNKAVRCYQMNNRVVVPVNPKGETIEGLKSVTSVTELPPNVKSISVITPPAVTEKVVEAAISHGITNIWLQPGAESDAAIERCRAAGINCIADHSCILVVLGYREEH